MNEEDDSEEITPEYLVDEIRQEIKDQFIINIEWKKVIMSDREYLRSLGYEVGERGRFSTEMKDELAKRDYQPSPQEVFKPEVKPEREGRQLYGYDKQGNKIGFVICHKCTQHMVWCRCSQGVHAPKYVHSSKDPLVFVPPIAV